MPGPIMTTFKPDKGITPREKQVLDLIVDGYGNIQIAELMKISVETVKVYVTHLFDKMGCDSRLQLAMKHVTPRPIEDRKRELRIQQSKLTHQLAAVSEEIAILEGTQ